MNRLKYILPVNPSRFLHTPHRFLAFFAGGVSSSWPPLEEAADALRLIEVGSSVAGVWLSALFGFIKSAIASVTFWSLLDELDESVDDSRAANGRVKDCLYFFGKHKVRSLTTSNYLQLSFGTGFRSGWSFFSCLSTSFLKQT